MLRSKVIYGSSLMWIWPSRLIGYPLLQYNTIQYICIYIGCVCYLCSMYYKANDNLYGKIAPRLQLIRFPNSRATK